MAPVEIAGALFGVLSSVTLVLSSLQTVRLSVVALTLLTSTFTLLQFGLTGALVAVGTTAVGWVRNLLILVGILKPRWAALNHWAFLPLFVAVNIVVWLILADFDSFDPMSVLPLVATILSTSAMFMRDILHMKLLIVATAIGWIMYEIHVGAWGLLIGAVPFFVGNLLSLAYILRERSRGRDPGDPMKAALLRLRG